MMLMDQGDSQLSDSTAIVALDPCPSTRTTILHPPILVQAIAFGSPEDIVHSAELQCRTHARRVTAGQWDEVVIIRRGQERNAV